VNPLIGCGRRAGSAAECTASVASSATADDRSLRPARSALNAMTHQSSAEQVPQMAPGRGRHAHQSAVQIVHRRPQPLQAVSGTRTARHMTCFSPLPVRCQLGCRARLCCRSKQPIALQSLAQHLGRVYATCSKEKLGTLCICRPQNGASWNSSHAATACTSVSVTDAPGAGPACAAAGACWTALSTSPAAGSSAATSLMLYPLLPYAWQVAMTSQEQILACRVQREHERRPAKHGAMST